MTNKKIGKGLRGLLEALAAWGLAAALLGACSDGSGSAKKCDCPEPKAYNEACSCGDVDCTCRILPVMDKVYLGEKEIVVEDQTGWFKSDVKSATEATLNDLNNASASHISQIILNTKNYPYIKMIVKQIEGEYNVIAPTIFEINVDVLKSGDTIFIAGSIFGAFSTIYSRDQSGYWLENAKRIVWPPMGD
jgi:hypothetical protein